MTSISEPVNPRRSMLVLSASSASTPSEPSVANRCRSTCWPSSGVWSTLKSPVCTSVPAGVCSASPTQSGMLCVTRRNSTVIEPMAMRSPGATGDEFVAGVDLVLFELGLDQRERQRRAVDRAFEQRPHVGHAADVVLVSVRQDEGRDAAVLQVRQVGHDEIHAQQVRARKHHAGIDHDGGLPAGDGHHVHAELTDPAERDDLERVVGQKTPPACAAPWAYTRRQRHLPRARTTCATSGKASRTVSGRFTSTAQAAGTA